MWVLHAIDVTNVDGDFKKTYYLIAGNDITVGRKGTDIVVEHKSVSRNHATIRIDQSFDLKRASSRPRIVLKDLSRFGTKVNEERMEKGNERELSNGDFITFGVKSTQFKLEFKQFQICTTGLGSSHREQLKRLCNCVGAHTTKKWRDEVTHLVTRKPVVITVKFLKALLCGVPIVSMDWLNRIVARKREETHVLPRESESLLKLDPHANLDPETGMVKSQYAIDTRRRTLFAGRTFVFIVQSDFLWMAKVGGARIFDFCAMSDDATLTMLREAADDEHKESWYLVRPYSNLSSQRRGMTQDSQDAVSSILSQRKQKQLRKLSLRDVTEEQIASAILNCDPGRLERSMMDACKVAATATVSAREATKSRETDDVNVAANVNAASERKAEEERITRERKVEEERIARERKAEEERIARERKAEEERIARERKAEEERIARERKKEMIAERERIARKRRAEEEEALRRKREEKKEQAARKKREEEKAKRERSTRARRAEEERTERAKKKNYERTQAADVDNQIILEKAAKKKEGADSGDGWLSVRERRKQVQRMKQEEVEDRNDDGSGHESTNLPADSDADTPNKVRVPDPIDENEEPFVRPYQNNLGVWMSSKRDGGSEKKRKKKGRAVAKGPSIQTADVLASNDAGRSDFKRFRKNRVCDQSATVVSYAKIPYIPGETDEERARALAFRKEKEQEIAAEALWVVHENKGSKKSRAKRGRGRP